MFFSDFVISQLNSALVRYEKFKSGAAGVILVGNKTDLARTRQVQSKVNTSFLMTMLLFLLVAKTTQEISSVGKQQIHFTITLRVKLTLKIVSKPSRKQINVLHTLQLQDILAFF